MPAGSLQLRLLTTGPINLPATPIHLGQAIEKGEIVSRIGYAAAGAVALALMSVPGTADAAPGDTTTTFTVTAGSLAITAPTSAALGSGAPNTNVTGQLGSITVNDLRGVNPAPWTASVASTDFTATGVTAVPASAVTYAPGAATATTGDGTFTPGADGTLSSTPRTAFSHTGGTGGNSATWNPTLTVAVPSTATATTYSGTVTHSVAAS